MNDAGTRSLPLFDLEIPYTGHEAFYSRCFCGQMRRRLPGVGRDRACHGNLIDGSYHSKGARLKRKLPLGEEQPLRLWLKTFLDPNLEMLSHEP